MTLETTLATYTCLGRRKRDAFSHRTGIGRFRVRLGRSDDKLACSE